MCRQSDQSWRAASLSGGKLWYDPLLSPADDGYGEENDMDQGSDEGKIARGSLQRRAWKMMCRKIAATVSSVTLYVVPVSHEIFRSIAWIGFLRTGTLRRDFRGYSFSAPRLLDLGGSCLGWAELSLRSEHRSWISSIGGGTILESRSEEISERDFSSP